MHEPKPYSVWVHAKGGVYVVLGVATCSTNTGGRDGLERSVIYQSLTYGELRYRELSEFMDGRFQIVDPEIQSRVPGTGAEAVLICVSHPVG